MNNSLINDLNKSKLHTIDNNLSKDGYTLIKKGISQKNISFLKRTVVKLFNKNKNKKYKGLPARDKKDLRIYNLPKRDKIFCDLISDYNLEKILIKRLNDKYYRWLPDNVPNYILNSFNARSSGYALDLHIDSIIPFKGKYPLSYIVLFVLEDMDSRNGATIVVPKSHLSGTYTNRKTNKAKVIKASAGDILILDSRTWHGTTENKTNKSRWLINAVFSIWSMKQQIDFPNTIPKKILNKLSNKQKQILGYCSIPPTSENDRINIKCGYEVLN
tara:strand:- start:947 stop:1765 length:819 start_codon:yes stop_codon:yes gene_type:complete